MSTPADDADPDPKPVIKPLAALPVLDEISARVDDVDDLDLDGI